MSEEGRKANIITEKGSSGQTTAVKIGAGWNFPHKIALSKMADTALLQQLVKSCRLCWVHLKPKCLDFLVQTNFISKCSKPEKKTASTVQKEQPPFFFFHLKWFFFSFPWLPTTERDLLCPALIRIHWERHSSRFKHTTIWLHRFEKPCFSNRIMCFYRNNKDPLSCFPDLRARGKI